MRAFGQRGVDAFDQAAHFIGHRHGGRFTRACDGQAHIGQAVPHAQVVHFGKAVFDGGHLPQAHQLVAAAPDHDLLKVCGRLDAPQQPDALVLHVATDFAHGGRNVLAAQGVDHLGHRHIDFAQFLRMQQNAQFALECAVDLDLSHAGNGAEFVGQLVFGQSRNLRMFLARRRQRQLHDGLRGGVDAQNDRLADFGGQLVAHRADGVAHLVGGFDQVFLEFKKHQKIGIAFVGRGFEFLDAADRLQGLFNPVEHLALDRVGRGAGVVDVHHQERQGHVGDLVDLEFFDGQDAQSHEHDDDDHRHHRAADAEIGEEHGSAPGFFRAQGEGLTVFEVVARAAHHTVAALEP